MSSKRSAKPRFLIDVNLPRLVSVWSDAHYLHVFDLNDEMTDTAIWNYAKENNLTIITKDTDFSDRILLHAPPPRVIHIRFGNLKMRLFHAKITAVWSRVLYLSANHKLVRVFADRIEAID